MSLKNILGKAAEIKAAIKARQDKVLDAKVAKAHAAIAAEEERGKKLEVLAKAEKVKADNKKLVFDNSVIGKTAKGLKTARQNMQKYHENIEKREKEREKKEATKPKYDPWDIKGGPFGK